MKIVYVLPVSWGGIVHYTAELANAMAKIEDVVVIKAQDENDNLFSSDVQVYNLFKPFNFDRTSSRSLVSLLSYKNMRALLSYKKLRCIKSVNPDIVHFTIPSPQVSFFSHLYKLDKNYNIVCTVHGVFRSLRDAQFNNFNLSMGFIDSLNEVANRFVKFRELIVHTEDNKKGLIAKGIIEDQIAIIPHGSFSLFNRLNDDNPDESTDYRSEEVILFFGYILNNKGVDVLIKSIPHINREIPNLKVVIAGEGDLSEYRKNIVDESKFEIHNEYIPNEMVGSLFQRAKVVVLPYIRHQGHSGVVNVAFAFGKPVVATNLGDFPNLVQDGKEGLIIPPEDEIALANGVIRILRNEDLRQSMSQNALKKARQHSWNRIAERHVTVYEKVIERQRE
ncbi:glycosyltransferase family 4 protein [Methanoculleus sp. FWC-SCC1]|uniref:Glycosyltransferase family 4 protein n=1 Tax=Methanoculleus frigidifontis TaxID=2584085 RepID=A0ABT8MBP5_9EURY|nr:glycosyltransferase family 4 protein [Methanoculleus sp. FWC-SCC1]MDN7025352.1 glycosyltransferase family 4 protein [Methanoculleus sp. FWC-SCC1]